MELSPKFCQTCIFTSIFFRTPNAGRAQLDTTTMPLVDSLSPRRRSGERVRERGFQLSDSMERAPLPSPLPARASQGEGAGGFHDGGSIQMRPRRSRRRRQTTWLQRESASAQARQDTPAIQSGLANLAWCPLKFIPMNSAARPYRSIAKINFPNRNRLSNAQRLPSPFPLPSSDEGRGWL